MTIASEIQRVQTNIANAYTSLEAKGATMPDARNSANLASTIDSVSGGGGGANSRFGASLDSLIGSVDSYGNLTRSASEISFVGTGIKTVESYALLGKFANCTGLKTFSMPDLTQATTYAFAEVCRNSTNLTSVSFPEMTTTGSGMCPFYYAFYSCTALTDVDFSSLNTISAQESFRNAFSYCSGLKSVSFPSLTSVSGSLSMYEAFSRCTSLETVDLSSLKSITGSSFDTTFGYCSSLTSVNLNSLESITKQNACKGMFSNCKALTRISFPSLTTISHNQAFGSSSSYYTFVNCTALTEIHFRADMQTTVEALTGYANKWGATNATVYFDL